MARILAIGTPTRESTGKIVARIRDCSQRSRLTGFAASPFVR